MFMLVFAAQLHFYATVSGVVQKPACKMEEAEKRRTGEVAKTGGECRRRSRRCRNARRQQWDHNSDLHPINTTSLSAERRRR